MKAWAVLGTVAVLAIAASVGQAQTVSLAETAKAGDCYRIQLDMKLTGEMRIQRDGKVVPLGEEARAAHDFAERVLQVNKAGGVDKSARLYDTAKGTLTKAIVAHPGMPNQPSAVYAVADRVAQLEGAWKKFDPPGWWALSYPDWRRG